MITQLASNTNPGKQYLARLFSGYMGTLSRLKYRGRANYLLRCVSKDVLKVGTRNPTCIHLETLVSRCAKFRNELQNFLRSSSEN